MVRASRVAILLRRSWPRVDWRTLIRGVEVGESEEMGLGVADTVVV